MNPHSLSRRDLRRLASELWPDPRCHTVARGVLDAAASADAKSLDRTVITAYLRHFPRQHPAFEQLRNSARQCADRRDWPWRQRGEDWRLWDADAGPARLANALLQSDEPHSVLSNAGLDGDLVQGEFVADAVSAACEQAADAIGAEAVTLGKRLIGLFENFAITGKDAVLAWALMAPWDEQNPPEDYRKALTDILIAQIGDPRFKQARWDAVLTEMLDPDAGRLVQMLRRWLTENTVREFFKVVGQTTNNPVQWAERSEFWIGYLDAGMIDDAWFALGRSAENLIHSMANEKLAGYARIEGSNQYANPTHSSLILSIGDLRVAEWSHDGSCRFWHKDDRTAPPPYKAQYFGYQLRAMNGGQHFEYIPHQSSWQWRFSRKVYSMTQRQHPQH